MCHELQDIPGFRSWNLVCPILKGYSEDRKYKVTTADGRSLLVRTADRSFYAEKELEFQSLQRVRALRLPTPAPLGMGYCGGGSRLYTLLSWEDGSDLETELPRYSPDRQYLLGVQAGKLLRKLHVLSAPPGQTPWRDKYLGRVHGIMQKYSQMPFSIPGETVFQRFLSSHEMVIQDVSQSLLHGDYHTGNLVLDPSGQIHIIDFNRFDFGAPWQEFGRMIWSAPISGAFCCGQVHGYFAGNPPAAFFPQLKFYLAVSAFCSAVWSYGGDIFGQAVTNIQCLLDTYDAFESDVPNWYYAPMKHHEERLR